MGAVGPDDVFDLIDFEKPLEAHDVPPKPALKLGSYRMVVGLVLGLFIRFQRLGLVAYVRTVAVDCSILRVGEVGSRNVLSVLILARPLAIGIGPPTWGGPAGEGM